MRRSDATLAGAAVAVLSCLGPQSATAQTPGGAQVFERSCVSCHAAAATEALRAPGLDVLSARTPHAIIDSLVTGAMRVQGARLSGAERRAVAEFITGTTVAGDVSGSSAGRCTTPLAFAGVSSGPRRRDPGDVQPCGVGAAGRDADVQQGRGPDRLLQLRQLPSSW